MAHTLTAESLGDGVNGPVADTAIDSVTDTATDRQGKERTDMSVRRSMPYLYAAALLAVLSLAILPLVSSGRLSLLWWVAAHTGSILVSLTAAVRCEHRRERDALIWLSLWLALAGVFGLMVHAVSVYRRDDPTAQNAGDTDRQAVPAWLDLQDTTAASLVDDRDTLVEEVCARIRDNRFDLDLTEPTISLYDCMETGTQQEQLNALRVIANDYASDFAPIVQAATVSRDMAVRVMAATVMAKLRKRFADEVEAAERCLAEQAADPELSRQLGEACLAYADSGLLSDELARRYRQRAESVLGHADASGATRLPGGEAR